MILSLQTHNHNHQEVNYVIHQEHKPEPYQPPLDIPQLKQGQYHPPLDIYQYEKYMIKITLFM